MTNDDDPQNRGQESMDTMITLQAIGRSAGLYPISLLYVAGVTLICLVSSSALSPEVAVIILAFFAIFAACVATWRELRKVQSLLDGQRRELISRIDQLSALLLSSGVDVPRGSALEDVARSDNQSRRTHS